MDSCEVCLDEGTTEDRETGAPHACWSCVKGAALSYEAERDYGRLPFVLGTLGDYLDEMVKDYGRIDNREAA